MKAFQSLLVSNRIWNTTCKNTSWMEIIIPLQNIEFLMHLASYIYVHVLTYVHIHIAFILYSSKLHICSLKRQYCVYCTVYFFSWSWFALAISCFLSFIPPVIHSFFHSFILNFLCQPHPSIWLTPDQIDTYKWWLTSIQSSRQPIGINNAAKHPLGSS